MIITTRLPLVEGMVQEYQLFSLPTLKLLQAIVYLPSWGDYQLGILGYDVSEPIKYKKKLTVEPKGTLTKLCPNFLLLIYSPQKKYNVTY